MWTHLKPVLVALWVLAVTSEVTLATTELNLYISKEHLTEYYSSNIDDKVLVVHKRENRIGPNHRLIFSNASDLPPFPKSVDKVTFSWLATEKEEVAYSIELQEDPQEPPLLVNPTISISATGRVPKNRSTFDVSLVCASLASGIARVGMNISLHYANDSFNLAVFFFIEKHCTADTNQSDMVQPTEVGEKTGTAEGSGDLSTDGSGDTSLADLVVLSPTTTLSSNAFDTSMYTVINTMKFNQSKTSISLTSSTAKQLSSIPLQRSDILFTPTITFSPTANVLTSKETGSTILSSSILPSIDDTISSFTSTHVASVSISSVGVEKTPSSLIIKSAAVTPSISGIDVPSSLLASSTGFTSPSETSLVGHPVTTVAPAQATSMSLTIHEDSSVVLPSTQAVPLSSTAESVSSISMVLSPSVVSQELSASFKPPVTSLVQSVSADVITPSVSSATPLFSSPAVTEDVTAVPSSPSSSSSVTSSAAVTMVTSSSSGTSSMAVTMVTSSSSTKPTTSIVTPKPTTTSAKDTKSSTKSITPSLNDFTVLTTSSSSVSKMDTTIVANTASKMASISPISSSSSSNIISTSKLSSSSEVITSTLVAVSSAPHPLESTSKALHTSSSSSSSMTTLQATPSTSVAVGSSSTVGVAASSETDEASLTLIIIVAATTSALITICIMLICIIVALMFRRRRKPRRRRSPVDNAIRIEFNSPSHADKYKEENIGPPSSCTSLRWGSIRNLSRPAQKLVEQLAVDRESIEMLETIKKGEYGWLTKGQITADADNDVDALPSQQLILAKMITGLGLGTKACGSCEEVSEFLDQATLLRGISHQNILAVMGLCSDDHQAPIIMYSYPSIGNLHTFLTAHKQATSATRQKGPVTPKLLMELCVQLAEAMKHLECFRIIHPDLQLRTCYLDAGYTLKLGDGALMSDFYPECYHVVYGAQRPVRWSALETLQGGLCSLPSNVWSFGITIWEIITMADFPYSEVTNRNVLAHVMLGSRLDQPHDCPNELYKLMCSCWHTSPKQRPMFIEIANDLKNLSRLYSNDDETGTLSSDSAFYLKHQSNHLESSPQAFHYNDNKDMSYLLTAPITAADAVSLTFSALGSTEDLDQVSKSCTGGDNTHQDGRSSGISSETSSSICSTEEPLSPIPHINVAPPDMPCGDEQQSMAPNMVPLRNEPPANKFLLKANGSRESTPDYRYSLSSDSQYSSSQFSSDASDNSRQHLLRYKRDSPEKRTSTIVEHNHKEEKDLTTGIDSNDNNPIVPSLESEMLSELMVSFDQRMTNSSDQ